MTTPPTTLLYGPTASGKTAYAFAWQERTGGNVISADARQVYQDMNIVVGKDLPPNAEFIEASSGLPSAWKLPHGELYLGLDLVPPTQAFTVSHWYHWVAPILQWHITHEVPCLIVGGTWQWLHVLLNPPKSLFVPPDEAWREEAEALTLDELQMRTKNLSSERWNSLTPSDRGNRRRLVRAIEVAQAPDTVTPAPLVSLNNTQLLLREATIDDLTASIQARVLDRWHNGALEETKNLMNTYQDWSAPAFSASGYPALREYLEKKIDEETTLRKWVWAERQYAKRQNTWIKKIKEEFAESIISV